MSVSTFEHTMTTHADFGVVIIRQSVQYLNVASLTVFIFDYFQTVHREVELIWKSRWSISKVVFLLARYSAFIDVPLTVYYTLGVGITYERCWLFNSVVTWSMAFGIAMSHIILLLRTYALWSNSVKILLCLGMLFVVLYIPAVVVLGIFLHSTKYGQPPLPGISGCYAIAGSSILIVDFALIAVYESVIMALSLYTFARRYRHSKNRLVLTLYRDGVLHFSCILAITCGYIAILLACPPDYADLLTLFQRVVHSLLTTRVLLNIRETANASPRCNGWDLRTSNIEGAARWKSLLKSSIE